MKKINEIYNLGQVYDFKVKKKFTNQTEIVDEANDINAYLHDSEKLKLFKGQVVKCRVVQYGYNRPIVELVDMEEFDIASGLTEEKLQNILKASNIEWETDEFEKLLLTDEKDYTFETQCHDWINSLINKKIDLHTVKTDCSNLLELSDLLDMCGNAQREFYQERLTSLIELLSNYIKAAELIANSEEGSGEFTYTQFIDNLFNKLKVSGFVYHPDKNFNILAALFIRMPGIMKERMPELLDIIGSREISIWKKEPFNSALSKLLEQYIREYNFKIDLESDSQKKSLIENVIKALAIQLLLAAGEKDTDVIDRRLANARLCLLSSYINNTDAPQLIDNAFDYLFCDELKYLNIGYDRLDNVHYKIANFSPGGEIESPCVFSNRDVSLLIEKNEISLRAAKSQDGLFPVFPSDNDLWKGLQVYLNLRPSTVIETMDSKNLKMFRDAWSEVENDLFNTTKKSNKSSVAKRHRVGEQVEISFSSQAHNDRTRFECRIEDEIGGKGYINISDIVPYSVPGPALWMFLNNGARLVYPARIVDVDADGTYHFSMSEFIKDEATEYYPDDEEIVCRLGTAPHPYNGMAPAVSREGLSVSVFAPAEFRNIPAGTFVKCRLKGASPSTSHIDCEITGIETDEDFNVSEAFASLANEFAYRELADEVEEEIEDVAQIESMKELDEDYVRQIIICIDRKAILDSDYIRSYNYLAFARLLCRLIAWDKQAAYYKGRMDIISMMYYFDVNSEIDEDQLHNLENANSELFENNKPLQERFNQLKVVSYMGRPEFTPDLYALSTKNDLLRTLSHLVIAYNVAIQEKMPRVANEIHEKIRETLHLKGFGSSLKKYADGLESETVEFKTSYIFPPKDKPTRNQRETILQVINSFLNTRGGTLYIGVNDAGRGVGVEGDLSSAPFYGDKDKYILDLTNAVKLEFSRLVAPFVQVYFDKENTDKDVLIVDVKPYTQKVPMRNGSFFYRTNSSKEGYTREEFAQVLRGLGESLGTGMAVESMMLLPAVAETDETKAEASAPVHSSIDKIATSRIRKNVLYDYLNDYVDPLAFLKFISPAEFAKSLRYYFDEENSQLTLTVLDDERKGYLILGYENGRIVKVPLDEILDFDDSLHKRYDGAKLLFASIARSDEDVVLTILKDNKTNPNVVMRADTLSKFEEGKLQDSGNTPCNENLITEVLAYDIIPAKYADDFKSILDLENTRAGHPNNKRAQSVLKLLHGWGINEI